jgi:hypothetical protein
MLQLKSSSGGKGVIYELEYVTTTEMQGRERGHVLSGVMNSLGYVIAKETDE